MLRILLFLSLVASISADVRVTQQCGPNGGGECPDGTFCVGTKFCMDNQWLNSPPILFVAGVASVFVQPNNVQEASCLVSITAEIDDFAQALQEWQTGDYAGSGDSLLTAVTNFQSSIATCVSASTSNDSFWDDLWDGVKFVIDGLCPTCGAVIDDGQFLVEGVDIISDWITMYNECGQDTADGFMNCGAAFGDSIQQIASAARAAEAAKLEA